MKSIALLFLSIILPSTVSAQTTDLKVKGVGVGTSYSTAIKKLGKPLSIKKGGTYPCDDDGKMVTARYNGLVIEFIESNSEEKLFVASMEVTSSKWSVSGIRIGANLRDVRAKFSGKLRKEKGVEVLGGYNNDGYRDFYFRKKKLVKMEWELNTC